MLPIHYIFFATLAAACITNSNYPSTTKQEQLSTLPSSIPSSTAQTPTTPTLEASTTRSSTTRPSTSQSSMSESSSTESVEMTSSSAVEVFTTTAVNTDATTLATKTGTKSTTVAITGTQKSHETSQAAVCNYGERKCESGGTWICNVSGSWVPGAMCGSSDDCCKIINGMPYCVYC
ncbi:hypothetical protein GGI42DRAFT_337868 [Trichoderma sp. SZMC 28013]